MKTLALFLFLLPSVVLAQPYHRVVYAPFQVATDTTINYDGNNTTQPDSVWATLVATGRIAGNAVHRAYELESTKTDFLSSTVIKHWENDYPAPLSLLVPIGTAGQTLVSNGSSAPTWGSLSGTNGGTGITSYTKGDILYSDSANRLAKLGIGSTNQIAIVANGLPSWSTATYPASTSANQLLLSSAANTITGLTNGTDGQVLEAHTGANPTWATAVPTLTFDTVSTSITVAGPTTGIRFTCLQGAGNLTDTIAAPTAAMNGRIWYFSALTAHTYTLYCTTDGFNAKGSSGSLATSGVVGDGFAIVAANLHWMLVPPVNETKN